MEGVYTTQVRRHTYLDLYIGHFFCSKYDVECQYLTRLRYDPYRVVPGGHRKWQIETAVYNWAGFFTEGLRNPLAAIWAVSE